MCWSLLLVDARAHLVLIFPVCLTTHLSAQLLQTSNMSGPSPILTTRGSARSRAVGLNKGQQWTACHSYNTRISTTASSEFARASVTAQTTDSDGPATSGCSTDFLLPALQ